MYLASTFIVSSTVFVIGVRSTKGFREGEHSWSISFLEPPHGTSVMVGVATKKANLYTTNHNFNNLIGESPLITTSFNLTVNPSEFAIHLGRCYN